MRSQVHAKKLILKSKKYTQATALTALPIPLSTLDNFLVLFKIAFPPYN
jgi:hypothetical protein